MRLFLIQIILFIFLCLLSLLLILEITSFNVEKRDFKNYETEGNTLVFKKNEHYNLMFTGISHARNFSRHKNHLRVESILNQSLINIAQGGGRCGVNEQFFYLNYFYELNNSVDKLVFMITPPLMYSENLPIASNTFEYETFSLNFLYQYASFDSENKRQRIVHYLQSKLKPHWGFYKPSSKEEMLDVMTEIDSSLIKNGMALAYGETLNNERFNEAVRIIEKEIEFAKKKGIQIIMIIPPAMFGRWPGHENLDFFLKELRDKYDLSYYDFSETVKDPKYYYDHHHLNTEGIIFFTENYLTKVLN